MTSSKNPSKSTRKKQVKKVQKKEEKTDAQMLAQYTQKRIQTFITVVGITVVTIVLFGGTGWIIDHYAGTKPTFLVLLVIASFPVTQILLYKKIQTIAKS